ncbi:unnamed protein product [Moneuplotes crassus]|uniref:Uncharacterized protein n=1 Tax=Euplotes crassus TaxID=5936 RepID=A0AAD1XE14_EUPCR|nr:unnamed protein product [Moneuplotes crassus]
MKKCLPSSNCNSSLPSFCSGVGTSNRRLWLPLLELSRYECMSSCFQHCCGLAISNHSCTLQCSETSLYCFLKFYGLLWVFQTQESCKDLQFSPSTDTAWLILTGDNLSYLLVTEPYQCSQLQSHFGILDTLEDYCCVKS